MSSRWSRAYLDWLKQLVKEIQAHLTPRTTPGTRKSNEEAKLNLKKIDFSQIRVPVPVPGESTRASIVRDMSTSAQLTRGELRAVYDEMSSPPSKRMKSTKETHPTYSDTPKSASSGLETEARRKHRARAVGPQQKAGGCGAGPNCPQTQEAKAAASPLARPSMALVGCVIN
jgi:hypothetical protein